MLKNFEDFNIYLKAGATGETYTQCPQCSKERKKKRAECLGVNVEKGKWVCHHCGWAGGLKGKTEYHGAHWLKPEYRKPTKTPKSDLPAPVIKWFADRGISEKVLVRNKIGYDRIYMPQLEEESSAIAFPYFRGGEHINTKWRDGKKNFRMDAGAELILYGLDDIDPTKPLIWVEGEMDKLSLDEAGFTNCVSVPNGAPPADAKNYASKFDWLDLDTLDGMTHILFFDMDEPGRKLEIEIARRLGKEICKRVIPPIGLKDANEVLTQRDKSVVRELIANAQEFPIDGVTTGEMLMQGVLTLHKTGRERGVATGWKDLDEIWSVKQGEMTVVTGIPNSGKSNWLDNLAVNIAKSHGWRWAVFSPENQPLEEHASTLCEKYCEIPFDKGPTTRMSEEDVEISMEWVHKHFTWILPDNDEWSLDNILDRSKAMIRRQGVNGVIIDPWNEIEHARPKDSTESEYIGVCLGKIRKFARLHNVHVFIVAHPTKLRKSDSGGYDVPTPYDISGSSNWRNKADNCITVYRHFTPKGEPAKPVEIHIQKVRFKHIGHIGMTPLEYIYSTAIYKPHAERRYAS